MHGVARVDAESLRREGVHAQVRLVRGDVERDRLVVPAVLYIEVRRHVQEVPHSAAALGAKRIGRGPVERADRPHLAVVHLEVGEPGVGRRGTQPAIERGDHAHAHRVRYLPDGRPVGRRFGAFGPSVQVPWGEAEEGLGADGLDVGVVGVRRCKGLHLGRVLLLQVHRALLHRPFVPGGER